MKIVLFNLHYSPNLGDGVIADCMTDWIRRLRPGAEVVSVDFSGRSGFGDETFRGRRLALSVLRRLPQRLRQQIVLSRLRPRLDQLEAVWRAELAGADMAIIGGGQILSDSDLNFPSKIARVARLLREAGVPTAIHAVGVSENWSRRGGRMLNTVFETELMGIGLRDTPSFQAWEAQAARATPLPHLARDPGLLAAETYGDMGPSSPRIGLGIAANAVLTYHADSSVVGNGDPGFFEALALELAQTPGGVRLFCDGAAEDAAALARLAARPAIRAAIASGRVEVAPVPRTPAELVGLIAPCRAVVAHRLHACIVGYAYGRPIVGLGWDRKVQSFFASIGTDQFFVGQRTARPAAIAALTEAALAAGIDKVSQRRVRDEARAAIGETLDLLERAGQGARRRVNR